MLEGEISQINLIERLVELWREQFTGAIRFENDGIIKIVYLKGGDILSASTNDRSDSIDEILMRAGKVSREHVKQALAKRKESETLGDALLNLGFITRKELTWARRVQVVGVIRSIAAWTEGAFFIVADYLPKRDEGTLFPLPQVLVELIVTEQDRARFERALDGGQVVFLKTDDFDDVWRRLGLNEDAEAIAVEIDGTKTATEVATASGRDTFNVYKLLHALAILGVLKPMAGEAFALDDFASAGVADAADMWNTSNNVPEISAANFELDAPAPPPEPELEPTVEQPLPVATAEPPTPSAWDEADEVPLDMSLETTTPSPKVPVWGTPPPPIVDEPAWGFDEAQLETARAAAAMPAAAAVANPPKRAKKEGGGRYGLLVALMVIAILGAAGWFGFQWWQGRQNAAPAPVPVAQQPAAPVPVTPATTAAAEPITTDTTLSGATGSQPVVVDRRAESPSLQTTTEPPAMAPLPRVTARATTSAADSGRESLDAKAREFAANPSGNFTVQIQILCDPANLAKLVRSGGDSIWYVPQSIGERACYRVFWGRYNTREQAQQALAQIPAGIRDRNSAVKAVPKG
ncbi:MAG TPA: DUF4388 domain-containing protein [Thermoanaerobaculia bacterium]|nr:DUF4388 domain-containing protein [Thermoanaerobaculia bacterium]